MKYNIKSLRDKKLFRKTLLLHPNGFTLIEILIVITVSAILSALLIPTAINFINTHEAVKTVQELKEIASAEQLFYENNTTALPVPTSCNESGSQLFHIYTSKFSDLVNSGTLEATDSDINYFSQAYVLAPKYSPIAQNLNNYCIRQSGIEVTTYIPVQYAGAVKTVPGAFEISQSGNMEEVGYYGIPLETNPEIDATLKYNW